MPSDIGIVEWMGAINECVEPNGSPHGMEVQALTPGDRALPFIRWFHPPLRREGRPEAGQGQAVNKGVRMPCYRWDDLADDTITPGTRPRMGPP